MEPPPIDSSKKTEQNYSKTRVGEGEVKLDKDRLAQALSEEKKRKKRGEDGEDRAGKKQKGAPGGGSHDVTEEELGMFLYVVTRNYCAHYLSEAYRMSRRMTEDPMANYVDKDDH